MLHFFIPNRGQIQRNKGEPLFPLSGIFSRFVNREKTSLYVQDITNPYQSEIKVTKEKPFKGLEGVNLPECDGNQWPILL